MRTARIFPVVLMALLACILSIGCDGNDHNDECRSGKWDNGTNGGADNGGGTEFAGHLIELCPGTDSSTRIIKITWHRSEGKIDFLSSYGDTVLSEEDADFAVINNDCEGWHVSGGEGIVAEYAETSSFEVPAEGRVFIPSIVDCNGKDYFVNIDHVSVRSNIPGEYIVADSCLERIAFGNAIKIVEGNPMVDVSFRCSSDHGCPVPEPIPEPEPLMHELSLLNGDLLIEFAQKDGRIINLVKDGDEYSLDIDEADRVYWNGDIAGWSLNNDNPYSSDLRLPVTSLCVPEGDDGIIRIVAKNGDIYSINTEKATGFSLDDRKLIELPYE